MSIEPISTVMTYQAQQVAKPVVQEVKEETADIEKQGSQISLVDNTTLAVDKVEESGTNPNQDAEQQEQQPSGDKLKKAVEQLNKNMSNSEAVFGFHDETNRVTIKIVDRNTKEVIKELPPEKTLDMIARVWEMAGILVDEKR